ncbi:MAG: DUF3280 domain-containing protein [Methylobacteriaceae bacterium]|nr:DUF3280 domain-containing protein [Methylobacteriaceae bacterium]
MPRVAIFDFELIDTSLEGELNGPRADEAARLARTGDQLRDLVTKSAKFLVVDIAPVRADARGQNLQACGGCDAKLAQKVGADLSITGTVRKVSTLILSINLYVREVSTGKLIAALNADFRGDTDESWSRALAWIARNRLLAPNFGAPE